MASLRQAQPRVLWRQGTFIRNERAQDLDAMQRHESLVALGERVGPATLDLMLT